MKFEIIRIMKRGINLNILSVENITHSFTERKLFDKASFYLHEGDKVGVIGINGTGRCYVTKNNGRNRRAG